MSNRGGVGLNFGKKVVPGVAGMAVLVVVVIGILNVPDVWSQEQSSAPARPQIEVAALKPNNGCENTPRFGNLSPSPGRLEMPCITLADLLQAAYGTFRDGAAINSELLHIEGGPPWLQCRKEYRFLTGRLALGCLASRKQRRQ